MCNPGVHEIEGHEGNPAVYIPGNCVAGQYGLTAPGPCSTVGNENQRRLLTIENPIHGQYYTNMATVDSNASRSYNDAIHLPSGENWPKSSFAGLSKVPGSGKRLSWGAEA